MTRWRWKTPTRHGRWYAKRETAENAAVKAGLGSRADYADKLGRFRFYPNPLTEIEQED